jgi:predicted nucleic acid-binding protein
VVHERQTLARLEAAPVEAHAPAGLGANAWRIAEELGWAKTYEAEYLALATLVGCGFVTLNARLHRRTAHLGFVVGPMEL